MNNSDFIIENGVLKKYKGPGGAVTIPDGVTEIGYRAFYGCSNLTEIYIPDGVASIEWDAFEGCISLTEIIIPDSVTEIGLRAFSGCSSLTEIHISGGVQRIDPYTFENCTRLERINIPDSVEEIGEVAFSGCCSLTEIHIPDGVQRIERDTFRNCTSLERIHIPDRVTEIGSGAFSGCSSLTEIHIPDGVQRIEMDTFKNCTRLERIHIPDRVTEIGSGVFSGCSSLTEIHIPDGVQRIERDTFKNCTRLERIHIPDRVTEIERWAFSGCSSLIEVNIPDSVTIIANEVFSHCSRLTKIHIPNGVMEIGDFAFSDCTGLTEIHIPDSVMKIGDFAFSDCTGLTEIHIPDSVEEIGGDAFSGCCSLTEIHIPDSVKKIGKAAFSKCSGLTEIRIPDSVIEIGDYSFYDCTGLTEFHIPYGAQRVGEYAFYGCKSLNKVIIPDTVIRIDRNAFYDSPAVFICGEKSVAESYCLDNKLTILYDYEYSEFRGIVPLGIERRRSPFRADEGKPFVFVSYSHKDRDAVLDNIKILYEHGWKIWYDEGLTIGDRYDETIKEHVKDCSAFLLFVTANSVNSDYIREFELPWAIEYGRPVIKCILEKNVDYEINDGVVKATVFPEDIESALDKTGDLVKGEKRTAKEISVAVNPAAREVAEAGGYAYCLYHSSSSNGAKTVIREAERAGCLLYDAVENGEDEEKLKNASCLMLMIDCSFLEDSRLKSFLSEHFDKYKTVLCRLEDVKESDMPSGFEKIQGLDFSHGFNMDMHTKLAEFLQKKGCRDTSVIPGFEYTVRINEGILINKYIGLNPEVIIEKEYGGLPVCGIGPFSFMNRSYLKSVILPYGLLSIYLYAFKGCNNLTEILIPDSVRYISLGAFSDTGYYNDKNNWENGVLYIGHHLIKAVDVEGVYSIKDGTVLIADGAFENLTNLQRVIISDSVVRIGSSAFSGCSSLTSVYIPDSVTKIGYKAFYECTCLTEVLIPDSVRYIGLDAFSDTGYYNDKNNWENGVLYIGHHLIKCVDVEDAYSIKDGTVLIADGAFENLTNLQRIIIPDSVTIIGHKAFYECTCLTEIHIPDFITDIGDEAFSGCSSLTLVYIPDSVTKIGKSAFANTHPDLTIHGVRGSYAETYAKKHGIIFEAI